jgi:4-hydroxybenzoate polyprenyltransferase
VISAEGSPTRVVQRKDQRDGWATFAAIGRTHITVIAALGAFTFGWLLTGRYLWFLTVVVALDWYLVNLFNRLADLTEDGYNGISGTGFIRGKGRPLLLWGLSLLLSSFVIVHLVYPSLTGPRLAGHLLGAFYNWPVLPGKRRLKQLYFWKNTASAMGFLITLFAYPLAVSGWGGEGFPPGIGWGSVFVSTLFLLLFELSYEVIYDLRDAKGDALAGIRTYPVVHGERRAVMIVDGLIFSSMAVLALGYLLGQIPWRIFIMIIPPVILWVFYKRALPRGIKPEDCIRITWLGAALMAVYHLWVLAGLPGAMS